MRAIDNPWPHGSPIAFPEAAKTRGIQAQRPGMLTARNACGDNKQSLRFLYDECAVLNIHTPVVCEDSLTHSPLIDLQMTNRADGTVIV